LGRRIGASSTEPQTLPRGTIFGAMALFGELAPSLATWTTPTPACASQPARARGPKALGGRDARAPAFSHPAFFAGPSLASLTSLTRLSLSLASVAAAKSLSSRRATSSKGPPAWAAEDFRYVYPFSGGVEAFSFKPATKRYTIDFLRSSYFLILHVIAFACGPSTFSLPALLCCLGLFVSLQTLGISLSYHRHLTHRSFQCHKYFEYFIAYCGALNMQGNPIWWAMNHTWHHRFSDTPWDPHTPREGLWTAHAGWFFEKERVLEKMPKAIVASHNHVEPGEEDEAYLPWFYKESPEFYDWLRQTYYIHQVSQVALLYLLGGWSFVVWGFVIRLLLGIHGVSAVNSFAHVWGEQPFKTGDDSKNNVWVAMVSSGEGWHNNHHAFPRSARHGLFPGQFDLTYNLILVLEKLGVVWDVQLPSDAQIATKLLSASEAKEAKASEAKMDVPVASEA